MIKWNNVKFELFTNEIFWKNSVRRANDRIKCAQDLFSLRRADCKVLFLQLQASLLCLGLHCVTSCELESWDLYKRQWFKLEPNLIQLFRTVLAGSFQFAMAEMQNKRRGIRMASWFFGWLHLLYVGAGSAPGISRDWVFFCFFPLDVQEWCKGNELVGALAQPSGACRKVLSEWQETCRCVSSGDCLGSE